AAVNRERLQLSGELTVCREAGLQLSDSTIRFSKAPAPVLLFGRRKVRSVGGLARDFGRERRSFGASSGLGPGRAMRNLAELTAAHLARSAPSGNRGRVVRVVDLSGRVDVADNARNHVPLLIPFVVRRLLTRGGRRSRGSFLLRLSAWGSPNQGCQQEQ